MPNTRVCFNAALVGGVIGGSLWYVNNVFGFLSFPACFPTAKFTAASAWYPCL